MLFMLRNFRHSCLELSAEYGGSLSDVSFSTPVLRMWVLLGYYIRVPYSHVHQMIQPALNPKP